MSLNNQRKPTELTVRDIKHGKGLRCDFITLTKSNDGPTVIHVTKNKFQSDDNKFKPDAHQQ